MDRLLDYAPLSGLIEMIETGQLRLLDDNWLDRIVALESVCYSCRWSRELMAAEFEKPFSLVPAIVSEEKLWAYSFSHLVADELHVLSLAVDPSCRRLGYASRLLSHLLDTAASKGAAFATLEVRVSNEAAIGLYKRFGFTNLGSRRGYYQDNGEDALILGRKLDRTSALF